MNAATMAKASGKCSFLKKHTVFGYAEAPETWQGAEATHFIRWDGVPPPLA
jgi:hypothetical protein